MVASRNSAYLTITTLILLLCALGHIALAIWLQIVPSRTSFEGSTEASWQMVAFVTYAIFLLTWPVYAPAAVLAGHIIATLLRRRLPALRRAPPHGIDLSANSCLSSIPPCRR